MMKKWEDRLWKALLWAIVTAGLYIWAKSQAAQWRGYEAVGGEALIFGLPVLFYALRRVARDWKTEIKRVMKGSGGYGV